MKLMMVRDRNVLNNNWVIYLANLFIKKGYGVTIACDTYSKLGTSGKGYDLDADVRLINLNGKTDNPLINVCHYIREKCVPAYFRFKKLIEREKPDILLSYFPNDLYNITRFQNHNIPIVQMIHGHPKAVLAKPLKKPKLIKWLYKRSYKKIDTYQVLMNSYKKEIDPFFEPKHIVRIANPVKQYNENELIDLHNEKKKIIYICRVEKKIKRPHLLIEAFAKIAKDFPDWKVEIYGMAKYKDYSREIDDFIREHHLEKQVIMAGYATDVEDVYRSADIHAFPSAMEGFSLAIADAMSLGLPHIGFADSPSINEIIVNGHNGFLVKDVDEFADKLKELMQNKELRIKFGHNAHEDMKAYAPDILINQWDALFNEIIQRTKK